VPRFLVRNNRPRRTINLEGRVLRASRPSRSVAAGEMWLDEVTFTGGQVTKLLRLQRLKVVDCEGTTMAEVQAYLDQRFADESEESPPQEETVESAPEQDENVIEPVEPSGEDEPPVPEDPPAPPADPPAPVVEEDPEPVVEDEPEEDDEPEEAAHVFSKADLEGMHYRNELQPLSKSLGLAANGSKDEIVERILSHQGAA